MLQLALALIVMIARAVDPSAACGVTGLWHEPTMGFTTRITDARWQTWSGGPGVNEAAAPAGEGWIELSGTRTTFGYDRDHTTRYEYVAVFDGCDAVTLSQQPGGQVLHFQRVHAVASAE